MLNTPTSNLTICLKFIHLRVRIQFIFKLYFNKIYLELDALVNKQDNDDDDAHVPQLPADIAQDEVLA